MGGEGRKGKVYVCVKGREERRWYLWEGRRREVVCGRGRERGEVMCVEEERGEEGR